MKSAMRYYGINLPEVRAITGRVVDVDCGDVREVVLKLWRGARRREERYAAVHLLTLMRKWSTDPDMWKRRVSIICQLRFKRDTDLDLQYANIEPNLEDKEFFIRKAIGWALRQYAWTDPQEIARYVRANESRLSVLSRREALKNIG